jgi:hypothetical protein
MRWRGALIQIIPHRNVWWQHFFARTYVARASNQLTRSSVMGIFIDLTILAATNFRGDASRAA